MILKMEQLYWIHDINMICLSKVHIIHITTPLNQCCRGTSVQHFLLILAKVILGWATSGNTAGFSVTQCHSLEDLWHMPMGLQTGSFGTCCEDSCNVCQNTWKHFSQDNRRKIFYLSLSAWTPGENYLRSTAMRTIWLIFFMLRSKECLGLEDGFKEILHPSKQKHPSKNLCNLITN